MDNSSKRVVSLRTTDIIRQEAADWLVRLDNRLDGKNLSAKDLAELRAWLARDPRHGQILKRQAAVWSDLDGFANTSLEIPVSIWSLLKNAGPLRNGLALACTLLVAVAVWFFYGNTPGNDNLYATAVGVQRIETFSDGSIAHVNTDSLIKIAFSDTERKVILLRGEAMFDVAHDAARPFIVYAQGNLVRAVGTKFVVRLTSGRILVAVAEGKVQLSRQPPNDVPEDDVQEVILLGQGESAEVNVDKPDKPTLDTVDNEEFERRFSWVNGRLVFVDETLQTIINEISRYTSIRVVIVDEELKNLRLSGRFQIGDTEALLEAIEVSRKDIQVSRNAVGNMIYISKDSG